MPPQRRTRPRELSARQTSQVSTDTPPGRSAAFCAGWERAQVKGLSKGRDAAKQLRLPTSQGQDRLRS